jgi:hypothetical protein
MSDNLEVFLEDKNIKLEEETQNKINVIILNSIKNQLQMDKTENVNIYLNSKTIPQNFTHKNLGNSFDHSFPLSTDINKASKEYEEYKNNNIVESISCSAEPFYATVTLNDQEEIYLNNLIKEKTNEYFTTPEYNKKAEKGNFVSKITDGKGSIIDLYYAKENNAVVFVKNEVKSEGSTLDFVKESKSAIFKNASNALSDIDMTSKIKQKRTLKF